MGLSIIIPTYQVPEYLDECINSLFNQDINFDIEVIIGVDNCDITLNHIKNNKNLYSNTKVFFFNENVGPYIIKNNLIDVAKYENVLFFDSDDIMINDSLSKIYDNLESTKINIIRLHFQDFTKVNGNIEYGYESIAYGVFGVKKEFFKTLNGFENWTCNADVEFYHRVNSNTKKHKTITLPTFYRRLHTRNLTVKEDTNMVSSLRSEYKRLIKNKSQLNKWDNPIMEIKEYKEIKLNEI